MDTEKIIDHFEDSKRKRRRDLLPKWIKFFIWVFGIFGVIAIISFVIGLFSYNLKMSIYGIDSIYSLSLNGVIVLIIFLLKALVSYGLWTEKSWAPKLALADVGLGILISLAVMAYQLFDSGSSFTIRLELILLIPYLIQLIKIEEPWSLIKE